ncbi:hypothetical protein PHYBLDRAFT_165272 [Phycomyces blakesleeanus NRRL 1555(-)]|uniref:Uncharacterized protein n=1 Tax=Phycomyces blakesleeanus (strain ATCC 8743b / DSM 1359 / FGSC 10004 / NBRC 33097 / NRRL 1555) TaxID=763407 RepID=A0A167NWL9_PHYB8|nr:hypothetical protein PHYBLDRAFT_165272 [Phycomyces blakesleeanus NRRL 1555(-)]OAD76761.1 hypothetical protein PHYBLDRAFT_165272 [Phycomyces blakesleeanus NRRL 1555(-)]|eukprot:XP_018294801.1 hypothetical protein PHYBLDRAFT_165272 [Phycomyces blakesleeanus NRRL 1555(-)]
MNYPILGFKSFKEEKSAIWDKILNIKYRTLKKQKVDKALCFQGMMLTDGVGVTILKQNFESERCQKTGAAVTSGESNTNTGRKIKRTKTINEGSFTNKYDKQFSIISIYKKSKKQEIMTAKAYKKQFEASVYQIIEGTTTWLKKEQLSEEGVNAKQVQIKHSSFYRFVE